MAIRSAPPRFFQPVVNQQKKAIETIQTRIDKWLWAARWYKTRALATTALKGGKVHLNGKTVKPAHQVKTGDLVTITQGPYRREITVVAISDRRGPASVAVTLYEETPASIELRQQTRENLSVDNAAFYTGKGRPTKRDRRSIVRFIQNRDS